MKTKQKPLKEELAGVKTISLVRAKEIMKEEGIEYTDDELKQVLDFISTVISITAPHYERLQQKKVKVISINTNSPHETKSIPLHPCKYRRAS